MPLGMNSPDREDEFTRQKRHARTRVVVAVEGIVLKRLQGRSVISGNKAGRRI